VITYLTRVITKSGFSAMQYKYDPIFTTRLRDSAQKSAKT
jgi:hypothetical protein